MHPTYSNEMNKNTEKDKTRKELVKTDGKHSMLEKVSPQTGRAESSSTRYSGNTNQEHGGSSSPDCR